MKKLKDAQLRGIDEARERLVELEKKHAKALKELQRAERTRVKTSRKRRTFHGYPKSDTSGIIHKVVKEVSDQPQPQARKISDVFKLQPGGQGKGLGFPHDKLKSPRSAESAHQGHSQSVCEAIIISGDYRKTAKDAPENGSGETNTPHLLCPSVFLSAKHDTKEGSENGCYSATDEMEDRNKAVDVIKDKEQTERKKIHPHGGSPHVCGISGSCTKKTSLNGGISTDTQKTESFLQDLNDVGHLSTNTVSCEQSKEMLSSDGDSLNRDAVDKKIQQANECVPNEKDDGKQKVGVNLSINSSNGFEVRCTPTSGRKAVQKPSLSQDNSQKSISSHRKRDDWRHLFAEEVPRRSPRLKSKERHEINVFCGQLSNVSRTYKKNKPTTYTSGSSPKENIDCSFPKPPVELTKNGGPLCIIADFALPDVEFAKLKLDKIRGISAKVYVRARQLISSQKSKIDSKKRELPVQQEADNSNLYFISSRTSAFHSTKGAVNCVSSGPTEGCSIPKITQSPGSQLMLGELVQERAIKSPVLNDHPVGLVDQPPLQGNAKGNDLHNCNLRVSPDDGECDREPSVEGNGPHEVGVLVNAHLNSCSAFQHSGSDVSKLSLSEGVPAEASCDGKCTLKATKPIIEPGYSGKHVVCPLENKKYEQSTIGPSSLELQEESQSVSGVEQRLTSADLSLTGDKDPLPCNEAEATSPKCCLRLGHSLSSTTSLRLSAHPVLKEESHQVAPPVLVEASCSHAGGTSAGHQPGQKDGTVSSPLIMHTLVQEGEVNFREAISPSEVENTRINGESIPPLLMQLGEDDSTIAETVLNCARAKEATVPDVFMGSFVQGSEDNLIKQQSQKDTNVSTVLIQPCVQERKQQIPKDRNLSTVLMQPCVQESEDTIKQQSQKDTNMSTVVIESCVQKSEDNLTRQQSKEDTNVSTVLIQPCVQKSEDNLIQQQSQKDTNVSTVLIQPCVQESEDNLIRQQSGKDTNVSTVLIQPCVQESEDNLIQQQSRKDTNVSTVLIQPCVQESEDNLIQQQSRKDTNVSTVLIQPCVQESEDNLIQQQSGKDTNVSTVLIQPCVQESEDNLIQQQSGKATNVSTVLIQPCVQESEDNLIQQQSGKDTNVSTVLIQPCVQESEDNLIQQQSGKDTNVSTVLIQPCVQESEDNLIQQQSGKDTNVSTVLIRPCVQESEDNLIQQQSGKDTNVSTVLIQPCVQESEDNLIQQQSGKATNVSTVLIRPCVQESEDNLIQQQSGKDTNVSTVLIRPCVQESEDNLIQQQSGKDTNVSTVLIQPCVQESEDNLIQQQSRKDTNVSTVLIQPCVQESEDNLIQQQSRKDTNVSTVLIPLCVQERKQQSQKDTNMATVLRQPCVQEREDNLIQQQCRKDTNVPTVLIQPGVQESEDNLIKYQNQKDTNVSRVLIEPCVQESEDNVIKPQSQENTNVSTVLIQPCVMDKGNSTNAGCLSKQQSQSEKDETFKSDLIQPGGREAPSNTEDCPDNLKERGTDAAVTCMLDQSESSETFVPVLMQACLEHATDGADNAIRAVAMSTYECSSCHEIQEGKMEVVAVCQAHVLVIWTAVSGREWTVQHKWTLAADGSEEFCSVQFVSSSSHLIVLTGGVFSTGNGRIYGCSEEAKYCMDLHVEQNMVTDHFSFAAMCILNENVETAGKEEADIELVLGAKGATCMFVTKWTLDSLCLILKKSESLPVVDTQSGLSSLLAVNGNSCLLLGTAGDMVILWNHKSSELLRSISCTSVGLDNLTCLTALTHMGLLFLTMFSCPSAKSQSKRGASCELLAVNPKTDKIVCLDSIAVKKECSCTAAAAHGQYVAMGQQQGDACLWNISSNQHDVQLSISKDAVSSIGFHQHRPRVAFGIETGCVHIFSLC